MSFSIEYFAILMGLSCFSLIYSMHMVTKTRNPFQFVYFGICLVIDMVTFFLPTLMATLNGIEAMVTVSSGTVLSIIQQITPFEATVFVALTIVVIALAVIQEVLHR